MHLAPVYAIISHGLNVRLEFYDDGHWPAPRSFCHMINRVIDTELEDYFLNSKYDYLLDRTDSYPESCQVVLVTGAEMRQLNPFRPNWEKFILYARKFIEKYTQEYSNDGIRRSIEIITALLEKMLGDPIDLKSLLKEFIPELEEILKTLLMKPYYSDDYPDLAEDLKQLISELKKCRFPMITLGLYSHKKKTIYLCYENIAKNKDVDTNVLGEAVLIHEYIHAVHFHNMSQRKRVAHEEDTIVKKDALIETVAEFLQYFYVQDKLGKYPGIMNWMNEHIDEGYFPGWGYAGAGILLKWGIKSPEYFRKIYTTSLTDWRLAYSLLNALDVFSS